MTLNLNLTDLSIMSELKTSPFGMCLVDTGYASFSAFDELKGQTPFLSPRPEELFNRTKRDGKKREGEKRGRNEERRGKKRMGKSFQSPLQIHCLITNLSF